MAENADAYVLYTIPPALEMIIRRFRIEKLSKPIISKEFSHLADISLVEGEWYVDPSYILPEYQDKFKNLGIESALTVGNAYDTIMLIAEAFERAPTKDKAVEELRNLQEFNGVLGRTTQYPKGIFQSNPVVKKIQNGKAVVVEE